MKKGQIKINTYTIEDFRKGRYTNCEREGFERLSILNKFERFVRTKNPELIDEFCDNDIIVFTEKFGGSIEYGNSGMRHEEELEKYYLKKGDRVIIIRRRKK